MMCLQKIANSIESLLHAIEAEESKIVSAEFEIGSKKERESKRERVVKAARELDPIVNACPCSKCSDLTRMTCKKCNEYYDWIGGLKGERE